ncbi:S-adenosyl-L-methionine-dependent methyltransferase [Stipitochalara longipes BDJ]|nr:S-adenosyl-L-methionine-dependent methyltransferase [Stipitochalara longipes BDJ]
MNSEPQDMVDQEIAYVDPLSNPVPALLDKEKTTSESNDNPEGSLQKEASIASGQSPHDAASGPNLGSQSSAEKAPLDEASLQGEEGLALETQHNEMASASTASTAALSVDTDRDTDRDSDNDSAIGDPSIYTTSTSVRSSVYQFVEEHGRTYHRYREGKYCLPNDEREQDRLDLQHHLFRLTLDGELFIAPLKNLPGGLHNVLDIATGTGIWAMEFADQFPSAKVIGTDLSPIQPEFVPPNCFFEVNDAEDPWIFTHQFDYIHGRALGSCFKSHFEVIKTAASFLRPGGYLELQDFIIPLHRCIDDTVLGTHFERWNNLMLAGTAALGQDWSRAALYKEYFEEVGLVDIVELKYNWPVGRWARGKKEKTLGAWYRENFLSGMQGFTLAVLTRGLGMTVTEVEVLLAGVRSDINSNQLHMYIPIRVVYGRKPV